MALAEKVLATLPADEIRHRMGRRFPMLSKTQLRNINVGSTVMTLHLGSETKEEVHLYVEISLDPPMSNAEDVADAVADLLDQQLKREIAADRQHGLNTARSTPPPPSR